MGVRAPACPLAHLPEGHYAAVIGTIPVPGDQYARLLDLATNAQTAVEKAVTAERAQQLQARADVLTLIAEEHKQNQGAVKAQLEDARGEINDREQRIRVLLDERHADLAKLEASGERAVKAEARDQSIQAADNANLRQAQLKAQEQQIDGQLKLAGLNHLVATVPPLLAAFHSSATSGGTNGAHAPAHVVDTTIDEADPPPLCMAIVQLAWHIRDPDLVALLATSLRLLGQLPGLQPLGAALMREAPGPFAALAAMLAQPAAPTANGSTNAGSAAPAPPTPAGTNGTSPTAATNGHSTTTSSAPG